MIHFYIFSSHLFLTHIQQLWTSWQTHRNGDCVLPSQSHPLTQQTTSHIPRAARPILSSWTAMWIGEDNMFYTWGDAVFTSQQAITHIHLDPILHPMLFTLKTLHCTLHFSGNSVHLFKSAVNYQDCIALVDRRMNMQHWQNDIDRGKSKYSEENLSHDHFVHHKPSAHWPQTEWWEASNLLSDLWHDPGGILKGT